MALYGPPLKQDMYDYKNYAVATTGSISASAFAASP